MYKKIFYILASLLLFLFSCQASFKGKSFNSNNTKTSDDTSELSNDDVQQRVNTDTSQDDDDPNAVYVPLKVYFNGQYSGNDAAYFKFYVQRKSPRAQHSHIEAISAAKKQQLSNEISDFCKCGALTTAYFLWEHTASANKGALHADISPNYYGQWIYAHTVSDKHWKSGNLENLPEGPYSVFLGADTENPAEFIIKINGAGYGYLRTCTYAPNSPLGTHKHKWDERDDMRLAFVCAVEKCPDDKRNNTALEFEHHFSYKDTWRCP